MTSDDKACSSYARHVRAARKPIQDAKDAASARRDALLEVGSFFDAVAPSFRKPVMVPIGPEGIAFMPGHIVHTHEVLVSLGANWFAETSLADARRILAERTNLAVEQIEAAERALADLDVRESQLAEMMGSLRLSDGHNVDADGDQINEEGLKYVEIVEPYEETKTSEPQQQQVHPTTTKPVRELDEFDRKLLKKICSLEAHESALDSDDEDMIDVQEESGDDDDDSDDYPGCYQNDEDGDDAFSNKSDSESNQEEEFQEQIHASAAQHISNRNRSSPAGILRKPNRNNDKSPQKRVGFADQLDLDKKSFQMSSGNPSASDEIVEPKKSVFVPPMKTTVVERSFDSDDELPSDGSADPESDADDMMLGPQISHEYQRRRRQFLAAGVLQEHPIGIQNDEESDGCLNMLVDQDARADRRDGPPRIESAQRNRLHESEKEADPSLPQKKLAYAPTIPKMSLFRQRFLQMQSGSDPNTNS